MNIVSKIIKWVEKKPLLLIRFDEECSESLNNAKQGFEHLTIAKPHPVFHDFKLPTLCLLELQNQTETKCYIGTVTRKTAISTFDSRLTLKKLRSIEPSSLKKIGEKISQKRFQNLFKKKSSEKVFFSALSPKLSIHLINLIAKEAKNQDAFKIAISQLPPFRYSSNINWAQEDAISSALTAFGLQTNEIPEEITVKSGACSGLSLIEASLYEDNVIRFDASTLPGFDAIAQDVTGRAVFQKGDERLVIYTANKLPLEKMLGVDLIYINETRGNIVMIQYKMLEEVKGADKNSDWIFRPDKQLKCEIQRMKLPKLKEQASDYRLNSSPFYFKFVKRKMTGDSPQSFFISLDHLNQIMMIPNAKGPKGGIRLNYETLDGTYLRKRDFISLIRSGYIGTHRAETKALTTLISEASKGNNALVLAWQRKIQEKEGNE